MSLIEDILEISELIKEEIETHIQQKANLSSQLNEFTNTEIMLQRKLKTIQDYINSSNINLISNSEVNQLKETKIKFSEEIAIIRNEIFKLENQLSQLKTDSSIIDSKISILEKEKAEQEKTILLEKQKQVRSQQLDVKLKNARERVQKVNKQLEQQQGIKNNLESFYKILTTIQLVISDYSPLSESDSKLPEEFNKDIRDKIISSKKLFDQALMNFSANDVTPFLIDAQKAYEEIVSVFIKLCPIFPSSLLDQDFSSQVFSLIDHGLILNTRHLNAVQSMLKKLEKGVEIAPLASFSNEVKEYFIENLTYLRITGYLL